MKKIALVILFLVFILSGCSKAKTEETNSQGLNLQKQSIEPKKVVENYFKYYNEKNKEGVLSTLTEPISELDENIVMRHFNLQHSSQEKQQQNYIKNRRCS